MRPFSGLLAGVIAGVMVTAIVEMIGHWAFPMPPGLELQNRGDLALFIEQVPAAGVAVLAAWGLGIFVGASVAFRVAQGAEWPAWMVVFMLVAGAGWMLVKIQAPWLMTIAAMLLMPAAAYAAAKMFYLRPNSESH